MISNDILRSIKNSIERNGFWRTLFIILQYLRFKGSKLDVYKLRLSKRLNGIYMRPGTSDFSVFRQIFMNDEYGLELDGTPQVIFDIGANIGLASLYFAHRFPDSRIYALEPDPSNFAILTLNAESIPKIVLLQNALWNRNTPLEMIEDGHDKWGIQVRELSDSQKNHVQAVSMEFLIEQYRIAKIDLLKIDIEGAEFELFEGDCKSWLSKVKVLVIELHDHYRPGCSDRFNLAISSINHRIARRGENIIVYNLDLT